MPNENTLPLSPYAKHAALYRAPVSTPATRRMEHLRGLPLRERLGLANARSSGYYVVPPVGCVAQIVRVADLRMAMAMAQTVRGMVCGADE